MKPIKFETIKRNALGAFAGKIGPPHITFQGDQPVFLALVAQIEQFNATGRTRPATAILDEWLEYGKALIEAWDVRCAGSLIAAFPGIVPAAWQGRKLACEMADNENCDWMVYPLECAA